MAETCDQEPIVINSTLTRTALDERNRSIYEGHVIDGRSFQQLADQFRVSKSLCLKVCHQVEQALSDEFHRTISGFRTRQTMQLESLIGELCEAWHKSKIPLEIRRSGTGSKGTEYDETTVKHTGPDPRYIDSAARLMADIRTMWGVDAPKASTVEITGQGIPLIEIVVGDRDQAVEFTRLVDAKAKLIEPVVSESNSVASQSALTPADATGE